MGTGILPAIRTHFGFVDASHVKDFLYCNMNRVVISFLFFVYSYMFHLFESIFRRVFRFQVGKNHEKNETDSSGVFDQPENQNESCCSENPDVDKSCVGRENSDVMETASSANTNKYEFLYAKNISGFVEEPETLSFTIHEFFECTSDGDAIIKTPTFHVGDDSYKNFQELDSISNGDAYREEDKAEETGGFPKNFAIEQYLQKQKQEETLIKEDRYLEKHRGTDFVKHELDAKDCDGEEKAEDFVRTSFIEEVSAEKEAETFCGKNRSEKEEEEEVASLEEEFEVNHENDSPIEEDLPSQDHTSPSDVKQESICSTSSDEFSSRNGKVDSITYEFFAYRTVGEGFGRPERPVFIDDQKINHNRDREVVLMGHESSDSDDSYIELEPHMQNSSLLDENIVSSVGFSRVDENKEQVDLIHQEAVPETDALEKLREGDHCKHENQELVHEEAEPKIDGSENSQETILQNENSSNYDVRDDTELTFEHEDIIEQLKLELKLARTGGLPTIVEESESEELETPKVAMHQLRPPPKIDEKLENKDFMNEIQKVYRSYAERMRKLDILNFQTMHAAGLLQLKDIAKSEAPRKSSVPVLRAIFFGPLWPCREGTAVVEPVKKIIADVHKDFEAVYVGQLCLSWEILHWQYRKAQELLTFDPREFHQYNQVAGEFQLFQVLLQRFIENEAFQGPRVQNYVENRCVVRNLLQVPVIKDDSLKDKGKNIGNDEEATTTQMLLEIIEESMRIFWDFLRADKDESNVNLLAHTNSQDFVDAELLNDILTDFEKKEKKLKDILRSGNCIIKKFQKHQEGQRHWSLLVAQLELKLICRVLNMSKVTTDQLIWCHEKLDKINFCNRKVLLEPTFLLFPC